MTLKALLHLADLKGHSGPSERYSPPWHSGSSHGHSSGWKSKSGVSGAAISALALLAFLFFLNTMQQTMMDNTMMEAMGNMETATILLKSNLKNNYKEILEDKKPTKNLDVEQDNTFWNTQRLEIEGSKKKQEKRSTHLN